MLSDVHIASARSGVPSDDIAALATVGLDFEVRVFRHVGSAPAAG